MTSAKTNFDISELVERVYERHSYAAAQKGLRFTFSVSHKVPRHVYGDFESIRAALSVITQMAIEDSRNGTVELNVDLQKQQDSNYVVKFSVTESSRQAPYWFSVALERGQTQRNDLRKVSN